jgi:hypothetical protein
MMRRDAWSFIRTFGLIASIVPSVLAQPLGGSKSLGFAVGQQWSVKSTPPTTAKIIIGGIEQWNDTIVVHLSVVDVPIPNGLPRRGRHYAN